jgi:hypothetical protein
MLRSQIQVFFQFGIVTVQLPGLDESLPGRFIFVQVKQGNAIVKI